MKRRALLAATTAGLALVFSPQHAFASGTTCWTGNDESLETPDWDQFFKTDNDLSCWNDAGVAKTNALGSDTVYNQTQLNAAINHVVSNSADGYHIILHENGSWQDVEIDIQYTAPSDKPIIIRPRDPGLTTLTRPSIKIAGANIIVQDFVIEGGAEIPVNVGYDDPSRNECNHCRVSNMTFKDALPASTVQRPWIQVFGSDNRIDHNILVGNSGDLGLVWTRSGRRNKIDHNYFGNRDHYPATVIISTAR